MNALVKIAGGKPSDVVNAMVAGLEESVNWDGFRIDMSEYGSKTSKFCYGCAATCAILHLNKEMPLFDKEPYSIGTPTLKLNRSDETIREFEDAVNDLRVGNWDSFLTKLFDVKEQNIKVFKPKVFLPKLSNDDWQENLEPYRLYAQQLKEAGY